MSRFLVLRYAQCQVHVPPVTVAETRCYLELFYFFCLGTILVATVCHTETSLFAKGDPNYRIRLTCRT